MRSTRLLAGLVGVLCLAICPREALASESIAGMDDLAWGATRTAVQASHPNFESWDTQEIDVVPAMVDGKLKLSTQHHFGLRDYFISSCRVELEVEFIENSLELVSLQTPLNETQDCRSRFKDGLQSQYGNPHLEVSGSLKWESRDTTIVYSEVPLASSWHISVTYSHAGAIEKFLENAATKRHL